MGDVTPLRSGGPGAPSPEPPVKRGDFVIYRDPEAYLQGKECTWVCRVVDVAFGTATLKTLNGERRFSDANPTFMRRVNAEVVMQDIDAAPLEFPGEMLSAGDAWLRQQQENDTTERSK